MVNRGLPEISRKANFQNISMHVLEISVKLQNAKISLVTLRKSILETLTQQFQKFSEHSRKIIAMELVSVIGGWVEQVELLKRNAT